MSVQEKLKHELKAIITVTLYFAVWLGIFMGLKVLILNEYQIHFEGLSKVLVGSLILAKVVLILQHVPMGNRIKSRPVAVDVIVRTLLYAVGTLIVLLLEKGFESRHEQGGFFPALVSIFHNRDMPHVWANAICVTGALLIYNLLAAINGQLGKGELVRTLLSPKRTLPNSSAQP
jgi:hypothetical protein